MNKKSLTTTALAAALVALAVAGAITTADDHDTGIATAEFVLYENHDVYWVFRHSDTICDTARSSIVVGLDARAAADAAIGALPDEADTDAAAAYVRGLIRGCTT